MQHDRASGAVNPSGSSPLVGNLHTTTTEGLTDDYQLLDPAPNHSCYGTIVAE